MITILHHNQWIIQDREYERGYSRGPSIPPSDIYGVGYREYLESREREGFRAPPPTRPYSPHHHYRNNHRDPVGKIGDQDVEEGTDEQEVE